MPGPSRPHLRKVGQSPQAPIAVAPRTPREEAFIPRVSPYLGQTILEEPLRQSNVLSPTGDCRDETSIRCGHA
jgi:hypothetical protein